MWESGLRSRSRKESEVFEWSRISNNTGSRIRICLSDSDSGCPVGSFLHHTSKLEIPMEMAQFLLNLLLKKRFLSLYHDFHWFHQSNFIPIMLRSRSRKFWKGWSRESESDILPPTPQPWWDWCPSHGRRKDFSRGETVLKIYFTNSKLKEQLTFY